MKKGEYVTKNPDKFTKGLVNEITDYIDAVGRPSSVSENLMIEVAHAILADYEFKVQVSQQMSIANGCSYKSPEIMYCDTKKMAELITEMETTREDQRDFKIYVEPNPYGVVKTKTVKRIDDTKENDCSSERRVSTNRRKPSRNNANGGKRNGKPIDGRDKREE